MATSHEISGSWSNVRRHDEIASSPELCDAIMSSITTPRATMARSAPVSPVVFLAIDPGAIDIH
jgi:hypothetical protein